MVKLKLKVGPKGQIIIPRYLGKNMASKKTDTLLYRQGENELAILRAPSINEALVWIRQRRRRLKAKQAKLGDLEEVDLI
jgi:bifunctional DNA-binding transcriptional regulator/antitoxin component of YhaV-PrlF toxin-antitoxin module